MNYISSAKNSDTYQVYGIHPVLQILKTSPERILRIETSEKLQQKYNFPGARILNHAEFNKTYPDINHQSLVALVKKRSFMQLEGLALHEEQDKILILDRITDVGNCGAIIRSAVAFGIKKIIIPKHDSCKDLGKLARSSAGLSELCTFVEVTNLVKTILQLKENGYWCVGLDGHASDREISLSKFPKLAIILGNEEKGMKDLLKKNCDLLLNIPISKDVESLNVSAAAAIAFYIASI